MTPPTWLRALQNRDFRIFWCGQIVSVTGTWMQSVAQSWLVLELTNSPFRLGLIGTLQFGPFLLFSFLAGVIVDRLPKRRLLLSTQTVLMLQSAILSALVFGGHVQYWHVAVLAAVGGIANSLDMPARQAFIAEMVGPADLLNAIALNSAAFNSARVVGPAAAGLVVAAYGPATAFLLNAISFLAVLIALLFVHTEGFRPRKVTAGLGAEILEGLSYAARTPRVLFVLSLLFVVSLFIFNYNVIVPLLAKKVLGAEAHGFGFLMAMLGAGALTGAVGLAILGRGLPPAWAIVVSALVVCAATFSMSFVRQFGVAAAILYVMGLSGILFMTICNTTVQLTVPDELRGRMMALYTLVFVGVTPLGSFIIGSVAEKLGVPAAYAVGGGVGFLGVVALTGWWRLKRRR